MLSAAEEKCAHLREVLEPSQQLLIAYSGGVDSGFLLWFAARVCPGRVTGVLADSPSLKRSELRKALDFAESHQLPLRVIETREMDNPSYAENPLNRCYFCKAALFEAMEVWAAQYGADLLCYGENADDALQDRPGRAAARQFAIRAPLQECGLGKREIRVLAHQYGLDIADKAAEPCLASRIPHGLAVTPERLRRIEQAEAFLHQAGFRIVRVRHREDSAWVQTSPEETPALMRAGEEIIRTLRGYGFPEVELDPVGYQGAGLL
ncbi:MAG: ATP-dependent sacrificial sulfur transferase LarE [Candidatus Methylacidiphilales bacterium]